MLFTADREGERHLKIIILLEISDKMEVILKLTPEILRELDLIALGSPKRAPKWLTPTYIAECMENTKVQKEWKPKVGDWYFCTDLCKVKRIESLKEYQSVGQLSSPSDSPIGNIASGGCDVYVPNPRELKTIINRKNNVR
jgi:hypothetical protein